MTQQVVTTLDDEEMRPLRQLAEQQGRAPETFAEAMVRESLARDQFDDVAWRVRLGALPDDLHRRLPSDISPEETEADSAASVAEVKHARRAARRT